MPTIAGPTLAIRPAEGRAAYREVIVEYKLSANDSTGAVYHERVVLQPAPNEDPDVPCGPHALEQLLADEDVEVGAEPIRRRHVLVVPRHRLDVWEDWWRSGPGGEVEPIAELRDHVWVMIELSTGSGEPARVMTNVVSGSWGALGKD